MSTYHRYPEDPTGVNPDNLVSNELHNLNDRPVRVVVPKYAPFFSSSLVVFDNLMQRRLDLNVDYRVPVLLQEATLRYGREVGDAILIENSAVSAQVRISYQCVGGLIQNNITNIVDMYEAFINDTRRVNWVSGILGKPSEFPPGPHGHFLSDVFGFEPLAFQMERIAQAIELGNSPAFDAILQAMHDSIVSEAEIDMGAPVDKYITLDRLMYAMDKFNFNTTTLTPNGATMVNGASLWIEVAATNVPDRVMYYWTIEHEGTTTDDFVLNSGQVALLNGKGRFLVQAVRGARSEEDEMFRLVLRKHSVTGAPLLTSHEMTLQKHNSYYEDHILEAVRIEDLNSPRLTITAKTHAAHAGEWNAPFN